MQRGEVESCAVGVRMNEGVTCKCGEGIEVFMKANEVVQKKTAESLSLLLHSVSFSL